MWAISFELLARGVDLRAAGSCGVLCLVHPAARKLVCVQMFNCCNRVAVLHAGCPAASGTAQCAPSTLLQQSWQSRSM